MKDIVESYYPQIVSYYRITYNLIFSIGLIYILYYLAVTHSGYLFAKNEYLQFLGLVLAAWGLILLRQSFKQYSIREFLGLQQSGHQTGQTFTASGILNYIRHPIYAGILLVVGGFFLFNPKILNLVTLICVIAYILIGIQLEEKKLKGEFGQQYENYKKKVPMLIPRVKISKKLV